MSKQTSQIVSGGLLKGAKSKIKAVKNDGLQEYVTIINRGTVVQLMSGWVLASLRGQALFPFPDHLMFDPGMIVEIESGQLEPKKELKNWDILEIYSGQYVFLTRRTFRLAPVRIDESKN